MARLFAVSSLLSCTVSLVVFRALLIERYGLNSRKHTRSAPVVLCVLVFTGVLLLPCVSSGQTTGSWWGSASWFDWSDYRATVGAHLWLLSLDSGTVTMGKGIDAVEYDLKTDLGMGMDVQPVGDFYGIVYLDRLGFRYHIEDDYRFFGRQDIPTANNPSIHELDMRAPRIGVDLDLIRYSFAKLGINYDYYGKPVRFYYRHGTDRNVEPATTFRQSDRAMTIGAHGQIMPIRLRGVPVILQSRVSFPIPFVDDAFRPKAAKIIDLEISGGLRPAIWETSHFGFSTFSASVEVGYRSRSVRVKLEDDDFDLKAHWQGAFVQLSVFY